MRRRLKQAITFQGVGLHSGEQVGITVGPADWGAGYRICWGGECYQLNDGLMQGDGRGTTLTFGDHKVMTVEHLLSSLRGLEIDDVEIHPNGIETPLLDGSGYDFCTAFEKNGYDEGPGQPDWLTVVTPLAVQSEDGSRVVTALPSDRLRITYVIDYPNTPIGVQMVTVEPTRDNYLEQLGQCRTFCLEKELEQMAQLGLAKGGSLDNAIVVGDEGPLNQGGYRRENELARHKALDFLGDLSLLGRRVKGHLIALRAGHAMHLKLVELLRRTMTA